MILSLVAEPHKQMHDDNASSALRITCHISAPHGEDMPGDDAHPFWLAVDELGRAVVKTLKEAGIDPDSLLHTCSTENGSHLTVSSDAPANAAYFWVYLPKEPTVQTAMLNTVLLHLARARQALPNASWDVVMGRNSLTWNGEKFHWLLREDPTQRHEVREKKVRVASRNV